MQSWFTFELDGRTHRVEGEAVNRTLAAYLDGQGVGFERRFREPDPRLGGACLVTLDLDGFGRNAYRTVDAGLILLPAAAGRRFWTSEGLWRRKEGGGGAAATEHPVIAAINRRPELECAWSTRANAIAALFEGYYRRDLNQIGQMPEQFDACLSRTIDYESLRQAGLEVFGESRRRWHEASLRARVQGMEEALQHGRVDVHGDDFSALMTAGDAPPAEFAYVDAAKRRYYRPHTLVDLVKLVAHYPEAKIAGAGGGLALRTRVNAGTWPEIIATEGVPELRSITPHDDHWEIGAAAPLTSLAEVTGRFNPALAKMLRRYGSRPLRNRATLGGYLAAREGDGELAPVLMALDARVLLVSMEGERDVPVAGFFEKPGAPVLRRGEIVASIILPKFSGEVLAKRGCRVRFCDAYKSAPRRENFPASVTAGFAVEIDAGGAVTRAWIAYSGLGPHPVRARQAEEALRGKVWSEESVISLLSGLSQEVRLPEEAPGAAGGGDRDYRRQLVITMLQKFFYQHPNPDGPPIELGAIGEFVRPSRPFFQPES
ncbi:MAG: FAD binding domain-containing protein [Akkermansiaceae bacterium]|nr:FAD binding domain-containing protein [Akkermansiaceae bacterium]